MKAGKNRHNLTNKLIIVRHGKAEELLPGLSDFERSLTEKGKIESREMAMILKAKEKDTGLIITSPAFRAIETALIFCREFGSDTDSIKICQDLYSVADPDFLGSVAEYITDKTGTITVFGHNPLVSEIAAFYAGTSTRDLPKSGVICISFENTGWESIRPHSGKVDYFLDPKAHL